MGFLKRIIANVTKPEAVDLTGQLEDLKILAGQQLFAALKDQKASSIQSYEFKVFSQWGDDGIIQYLIHNLSIKNKTFIEFGVQDYSESNTRYLLMNNNWSGFIMDGSQEFVQIIKSQPWFWKYDLTAEAHFITRENVNDLLKRPGFNDLGILHIDIDGVDYWVWEQTETRLLNPSIVIIEYNSIFGADSEVTVPYDPAFYRTRAHHSNMYYGASLSALVNLSKEKGYVFVGCNSAGNNAFFIRKDLQTDKIREITAAEGYADSKFRESRDESGALTYLKGKSRLSLLKDLEIFNIKTKSIEKISSIAN